MKCIVLEPFDGHERGHELTGEDAQAAIDAHPRKVSRIADIEPAPPAPPATPVTFHDNDD